MNGVMVGRERELAEAFDFLDQAARRACWLLSSSASRESARRPSGRPCSTKRQRGRAVSSWRGPPKRRSELPFAVLTDLLGSTDEQTLSALPSGQRLALEQALRRREIRESVDPVALALAVAGVLRSLAASAPVVVAIDDAQWIDPPSRRALWFALRRLDEEPVGVVATVRSEFEEQLLGLIARDPGSIVRVQIEGLGEQELAQLVAARTGKIPSPLQLNGSSDSLSETPTTRSSSPRSRTAARASQATRSHAARRLSKLGIGPRGRLDRGDAGRFDDTVGGPGVVELREAGIVDVRSGTLRFAHPLLASTLIDMHTDGERRSITRCSPRCSTIPTSRRCTWPGHRRPRREGRG